MSEVLRVLWNSLTKIEWTYTPSLMAPRTTSMSSSTADGVNQAENKMFVRVPPAQDIQEQGRLHDMKTIDTKMKEKTYEKPISGTSDQ